MRLKFSIRTGPHENYSTYKTLGPCVVRGDDDVGCREEVLVYNGTHSREVGIQSGLHLRHLMKMQINKKLTYTRVNA